MHCEGAGEPTQFGWGEFRDGTDAIEDQEIKDQDSLAEDSGFDLQAKGQGSGSRIKDQVKNQ